MQGMSTCRTPALNVLLLLNGPRFGIAKVGALSGIVVSESGDSEKPRSRRCPGNFGRFRSACREGCSAFNWAYLDRLRTAIIELQAGTVHVMMLLRHTCFFL